MDLNSRIIREFIQIENGVSYYGRSAQNVIAVNWYVVLLLGISSHLLIFGYIFQPSKK